MAEIAFTVPSVPVAQPRQRHCVGVMGGRARAMNYLPNRHPVHAFKASVRHELCRVFTEAPLKGLLVVYITFVMPRPASMVWKCKPMPRVPCGTGPDLDNMAKSTLDAMNELAYDDDRQISSLCLHKAVASGYEQAHVLIKIMET